MTAEMTFEQKAADLIERHKTADVAIVAVCNKGEALRVIERIADQASLKGLAEALAHCASGRRATNFVEILSFLRGRADCDTALNYAVRREFSHKTIQMLSRQTTVEGRSRAYANAYEIGDDYGKDVFAALRTQILDYDIAVAHAALSMSLRTVQHLAALASPRGICWALAVAVKRGDPDIRAFLEGTNPDYDDAVMHAVRHDGWDIVADLVGRSSVECKGWTLARAFNLGQIRVCDAIMKRNNPPEATSADEITELNAITDIALHFIDLSDNDTQFCQCG